MANQSVILITHDETAGKMQELIQTTDAKNKPLANARLAKYVSAIGAGIRKATVEVDVASVKASGTFTFSGVTTANDTVLINGVTFTAVASGATGNQWNNGATASDSATNLAAAINASVTALVSGYVTASSVAGVVTVTAARPGILGNCITIAKGVDAGTVDTVSGARLTGGTAGTVVSYTYGS